MKWKIAMLVGFSFLHLKNIAQVMCDVTGGIVTLTGSGIFSEADLLNGTASCIGCTPVMGTYDCTGITITEIRIEGQVTIDENWDLRVLGADLLIVRIVAPDGQIIFSGAGENSGKLLLLSGTRVIIEEKIPVDMTDPIVGDGEPGQKRFEFYNDINDNQPTSTFSEALFAEITLSGGLDVNGPLLPITLLAFTGAPTGEGIQLDWTTATELNNDYMAVERSTDGVTFDEIERIPGRGTTYEPHAYHYLDAFPAPGINYYRLRQVDYDGTTEYHPVISVVYEGESRLALAVFPNPAGEELRVRWSAPARQDGTLRLLTAGGQELARHRLPAGGGVYYLPVEGLAPGLYILQVQQGAGVQAMRFVKE